MRKRARREGIHIRTLAGGGPERFHTFAEHERTPTQIEALSRPNPEASRRIEDWIAEARSEVARSHFRAIPGRQDEGDGES